MEKVVIIGGMPRSGTNLLRRVVGSHSDIAMPPVEFMFFQKISKGKSVEDILSAAEFQGRYGFEVNDLYGASPESAYRDLLFRYAKGINKTIAGEKSPRNEFHFAKIKESVANTDLKFLQIIRNPLDVVASYKKAPFRSNQPTDQQITEEIRLLAEDWNRSVSIGLARAHSDPDSYMVVKYECLTASPEPELENICRFLGVDCQSERMLGMDDFSEHNDNTSFSDPETNKCTKEAGRVRMVKSRKGHLSQSEMGIVTSICAEVALAFGYEDKEFQEAVGNMSFGGRQDSTGLPAKVKKLVQRLVS